MKRKHIVLIVAAVFLAVLAWRIVMLVIGDRAGSGRGYGRPPVAVEVAAVKTGPIQETRELTGSIHPLYQYIVAPKVSGRLVRINKRIGDPVRRGELIAKIDDGEYQQQVLESEANLKISYANLAEAGKRMHGVLEPILDVHFGRSDQPVPGWPELEVARDAESPEVSFTAVVDPARPVRRVLLCVSDDGAYTFEKIVMPADGDGHRLRLVMRPQRLARLAAFVEVEYADGLYLTSRPHLGEEFALRIRPAPFGPEIYLREHRLSDAESYARAKFEDKMLPQDERLQYLFWLGQMLNRAARSDRAIEVFEEVMAAAPESHRLVPLSVMSIAYSHRHAGEMANAIERMSEAVRLFPKCEGFEKNRGEYEKAQRDLDKWRGEHTE